ncbi:fimbria/pilus outer membrane usher protein [Escherichia coli]|nr:fimbria/pilus outer membrane usher protein [Escherichia coli]HAL6970038.1 fimbria/pilus outer membrane usher protein [Escherichia coli]HAW8383761.1 fimbria/pilus outer membrane usher protein [Escherichia coli]
MSYLNLRLYQRNTQCLHIRKHSLAGFFVRLFVACAFAVQAPLSSAELYFNPRFLADDPQAVADLSRFENGQELPPGTYRVDIYLNNGYMATRDVTFNTGDSEQGIVPCLTRAQLASMGLNTASVSGMNLLADDACVPLTSMIHDATAHLDVGQQRLNLTIPQAFMSNRARGYIPPELWDPGINAGLLNYNFSGNSVQNRIGGNSHYAYLNLQSGLNIGAWRLRDNTTWSYNSSDSSSGSKNKWQHINTWLERDIIPLRSRLTLGDGYTQGDIFDGINFRGAQLASDDNMLPDSQRGFAPVIHGIARGTAIPIGGGSANVYVNLAPAVNVGQNLVVDLSTQIFCHNDYPETITDYVTLQRGSAYGGVLSSFSGTVKYNGSSYPFPTTSETPRGVYNSRTDKPWPVALYLTPVSSAGGVAIKAGSLIAVLILRQTNNYNSDDFQFVWNIYANNDVVVPTGGCDVSARDVTVTLPDYPGSVPIPLTVYCAKSQNLGYYLSGTTADAGNSIFTNTASFSPAQGVGVQLTRNGTIIPANNTVSLGAVGTSAVSLGLTANYARTGGQVTAGNVQSIIGVTFVYQ